MQTSTGVKDILTQYWIEDLLTRHRAMKEDGIPQLEIQTTLEKWVQENDSRIYNGHLTTRGAVTHAYGSRHMFTLFDSNSI